MDKRCYILSATQVSCQIPLCEDWMTTPQPHDSTYARAIEPDSREFIVPSEARRMSRILKRAICSSVTALNKAQIKQPDAIVTGTGMGCMENSEKFLTDMCHQGEHCLKPTLFMQSTHNTISSQIAITLKCHGYNNTYSHKGLSFESALLDAWLQIKTGSIQTALVGSHDEVTPFSAPIIQRINPLFGFISEASVSMVLSSDGKGVKPLCEIISVVLLYKPELQEIIDSLGIGKDSVLMMGINGNEANDEPYLEVLESLSCAVPVISYKPIFGENFSSPAIAIYAGANILSAQRIPEFMFNSELQRNVGAIKEIVIVNHSDKTVWSIVKLQRN